MKAIQAVISGKVQGVFFRYFTRKKAKELRLTGTVENLPNGSVRVLAKGPANQIEEFIDWCHIGSPASTVEKVRVEEIPVDRTFDGFTILR